MKVTVNGAGGWSGIDEIEIRGATVTAGSAPAEVAAGSDGGLTVYASWSEVSGATEYEVVRDGVSIARTNSTSYVDRQLEPNTTCTFQVKTVDSNGTSSPASIEAHATTGNIVPGSINYSRCGADDLEPGCAYSSTVSAAASHPDTGTISLTDGGYGSASPGPEWQGRAPGSYSFTVDLGADRPLTEIKSNWLKVAAEGVNLPARVSYTVSFDGENYQTVAVISRPATGDIDQAKPYRAVGLNTLARYVEVAVPAPA